MQKVYLDNAASTPVLPEVVEAMQPYFSEKYGNPSAIYKSGQTAKAAIDEVRRQVAQRLGCDSQNIVFTSGATEGNNLAIKGTWEALDKPQGNIIVSAIEHHSVLEVVNSLVPEGVTVHQAPVDSDGVVKLNELYDLINDQTFLVSIMLVNNEIGTIQPIKEIGEKIEHLNKDRMNRIFFHTDAVQGIGYLQCLVEELKVDLLTFSGHKIFAPKGCGVIYIRDQHQIKPQLHGGGQENHLRSGTENVPAIVGLGQAVKMIDLKSKEIYKYQKLTIKILKKLVHGIEFHTKPELSVPSIVNFRVPGISAQDIIIALDNEGISVSAGSACQAGVAGKSHVLSAIGLSDDEAREGIRLSFGRSTKKRHLMYALDKITIVLKKLAKKKP